MKTEKKKKILKNLFQKTDQKKILQYLTEEQNPVKINNLYTQIQKIEETYKGGLLAYTKNSQNLITSQTPKTPNITIPKNSKKIYLKTNYEKYETKGSKKISKVAFVLVAGGLGERLGSKNIKISLTCELITNLTFMDYYLKFFEELFLLGKEKIQLFIMTSGDTHDKTVEFLKGKNYSGFLEVFLERQDKVPCVRNFENELDFDENLFLLRLKPHGHGDVHGLVRGSGVLDRWEGLGIEYVYFFQDTNPFSLSCLPVVLGVSLENDLDMNFLTCQRKPDEKMGTLVTDDNFNTFNIEYNLFEDVLKNLGKTDELDENGYSSYPGNTNCFLLKIKTYNKILQNLSLKEFINPKFDKTGNLKSSFRLECLMQDIALNYKKPQKVGTTQLEKELSITAAKNNLQTGFQNQLKKIPSETIVELENDIYFRNFKILQYCGVKFANFHLKTEIDHFHKFERSRTLSKIDLLNVPRIVILPSFGIFLKDLKKNFVNLEIDVGQELSLVFKGKLFFRNCRFSRVSLFFENKQLFFCNFENLKICNADDSNLIRFEHNDEVDCEDLDYNEILRGYKIVNRDKAIRFGN